MTDPWKGAPAWANYTAIDSNGARWFYEHEPALARDLGMFTAGGNRTQAAKVDGWETSLVSRVEKPKRLVSICAFTVDALRAQGWSDELMVSHGYAEWRT